MLLVAGKVRFAEGDIDRIRPEIKKMVDASMQELGCIEYGCSVDATDPNLFRIVERWVDREALKAHFQTAHMAEWNAVLATTQMSDQELFMMEGDQLAFEV